ncbi:hypothetical protein OQJ18_12835 [Fluoribacter dumoffii]|uniref:Enhanced entry protein EnhB n=1 Tax=Fluoribacter dumoffii TaxID=463 RepID=A0A377GE85_9GAMM|nr:hypothetical protein [Fluoribacter dumoffii]KTC91398.1 hypothetical protein Ldum_2466 [Fluoribacter dumoffii NY 23]MCW8387472.1 hypothetical protein [Fluoribacter dumoffii]MCW8417020.1 hypothetical protein [Fluoribacter dumoffii]MCW8455140.1 hypothetical protein [Fluoribacter dumoffii]MCW8460783.1 hypothetical protein [Fluoribacter dumoffii]
MRSLIFLCCSLWAFGVAAESTLPAGCQAIAVQGESVTLKAKKSSLIFIHNLASTDLWITHPVTNPSASAGWTTRLQAGNWSALSLNKGPFALNCIESKPGHEQQVPCEGLIAVCKWKGVKIPAKDKSSTFWAAEDMSLSALTAAVGARGFVIPVSKQ